MNKPLIQIGKTIKKEIDIQFDDHSNSKDQLIKAISERVAYLLEKEPALLLSYLYRLDVSEDKVQKSLSGSNDDSISAIANLIFERQMQRVKTKSTLKQRPIEGWEW